MSRAPGNIFFWLVVAGLGVPMSSFGEDRDPARLKKKPTSRVAKKADRKKVASRPVVTALAKRGDSKTVGDILRNIEASGFAKKFTKSQISIQADNAAALPPATKKALLKVSPPRSLKMFQSEDPDEKKLEKVIDQEIAELFKLTQKYASSNQRGELWLRLAELYGEKSRFIEYRLQSEYDRKLADWERTEKKTLRPSLDLRFATDYNKKAVQLYDWFQRDFPNDRRMDQVLFFLGYNSFELGNVKKGEEYYKQLVEKYPQSIFVAESHFALGEYYFENEKWAEALPHYARVLQDKASRVKSFAMYKIAWCQYRLGDVAKGMKSLESVIRSGLAAEERERSGQGRNVSRIRLASEALRDLVIFFAEAGDFQRANTYFRQFGKEEQVLQIMDRLGGMYSDSGRRQAAEFIYRELLDANPTGEKAFDYQLQIVQGYSASGDSNTFKKELFRWVEEYGPDSRWHVANSGKADLMKRADETREKTLRNYILQLHKEAQKSRSQVTQKIAKEGYQVYIRSFASSPLRGEMHFYFGELLYDMGDYEQAGANYVWVVENAPRSRFHEDAILNSIIALERTLTPEAELRSKIGKSQDRFPFGPNEERFALAVERYVKIYPSSSRAVDARFKLGRIHYIHNQFDEAIKIFQAIVRDYPKSKVATFSANLILDIFNIRKDYDSMARVGQEFLKNPNLKGQLDVDVEGIVERASFKKGTDLELEKDYMGAAVEFEKFYLNNPKSALVTSSAFNAGVNFERAGIVSKSLKLYDRVLQTKDAESLALRIKARQLQARLYEKTGQYEKAAAEFEAFATENPKDPLSPDLWYNVAVIYDGLRKSQKAIRAYEKFYETSRKASKTEAIFRIGEIYERMEKWLTASKYYERYLTDGGRDTKKIIEAHLKLGQLHKRMGKVDAADSWFRKTLGYQRRMGKSEAPSGSEQAAEARFELASRQLANFKQMRLPRNPADQQKVLKQKLNFLNQLNSEFLEVIKFDDAEFVVASLMALGSAYENMTQSILGTPVPAGLNPDQTKAYKEELEKFVAPIRQKAVENYRGAVDKGFEFQVYNAQLALAQNALSRLAPDGSELAGRDAMPIQYFDTMGL